MSYIDELRTLADSYGIATHYTSAEGEYKEISEDTLLKTLSALGVAVDANEDAVRAALAAKHDADFARPLPPCVVATEHSELVFPVHVYEGEPAELTIVCEDGTEMSPHQVENWNPPRTIAGVTWGEASFKLPYELPQGWHRMTLKSTGIEQSIDLIVTPQRLSVRHERTTGVMAQLYSVRSEQSWGVGDFHDLGLLAETMAKQTGADFLLINPLHAAEPFPPLEDSPYLPTTRRFINPLYIRIEDIDELAKLDADVRDAIAEMAAGFQASNHDAAFIERNPIYEAKLQVLRELHMVPRDDDREAAYQAFLVEEGEGLTEFARWCAEQELSALAAQNEAGSHAIPPEIDELVDFYCWLQWICDQQLAAAQQRALDAGMAIGVMADLAVGVHPGGADASTLAEYLAPDASVGAPPDGYNQHGQDWSQPPWHPVRLAEAGYRPWRDMLRTVLRHSGGIRVDHILGLFRLWWIPRCQAPTTGTYVYYDHNALVGILALEAERAGAVVIGEDLGTFDAWIQEALADRGVLGTSIVWFEGDPDGSGPRRQHNYRHLALTSVTTHDLPPTAGYLAGEHIALRDRLGLFTTDVAVEDRNDLEWQNKVLNRVSETLGTGEDYTDRARDARGDVDGLLDALHTFMHGTPSMLTCTALVDLVNDVRAQNQPGTTKDQYANWCVPLCDGSGKPVLLEDLTDHLAHAARARRHAH